MPTPPPGIKAGQFFKNVTTSTLKDLSVDDFLGAMGVITAILVSTARIAIPERAETKRIL
jgi:hypothetical protein